MLAGRRRGCGQKIVSGRGKRTCPDSAAFMGPLLGELEDIASCKGIGLLPASALPPGVLMLLPSGRSLSAREIGRLFE